MWTDGLSIWQAIGYTLAFLFGLVCIQYAWQTNPVFGAVVTVIVVGIYAVLAWAFVIIWRAHRARA